MFLDTADEIWEVLEKVAGALLVVPKGFTGQFERNGAVNVGLKGDKKSIGVEEMRDIDGLGRTKGEEFVVVINPAGAMTDSAQNAALKTLEEPSSRLRFLLVTNDLAAMLPTVKSRLQIYVLRQTFELRKAPSDNAKIMELAKRLTAASMSELVGLANDLAKERERAVLVVEVAIEMLYKTYLMKQNQVFLTKLEKLFNLHNALMQNGHVKLHIVADML